MSGCCLVSTVSTVALRKDDGLRDDDWLWDGDMCPLDQDGDGQGEGKGQWDEFGLLEHGGQSNGLQQFLDFLLLAGLSLVDEHGAQQENGEDQYAGHLIALHCVGCVGLIVTLMDFKKFVKMVMDGALLSLTEGEMTWLAEGS